VTDEASKLNVNTATREALLALPKMTETWAEAIIDRRKNRAGTLSGRVGEMSPERTTAGLPGKRSFRTVRELGLISGLTEEILYGEDRNLNGILENNENDGDKRAPTDNQDGVLDKGLLSYVTVYSYELNRDGQGQPRININTASAETLETELELNIGHINWIMENRGAGFKSIFHLLEEGVDLKGNVDIASLDPKKSIPLDIATFCRIGDRITVTDAEVIPGRININTAGSTVLQTLPEIDGRLADRIVEYREGSAEGFANVAEILFVEGVTLRQTQVLGELITVRSNVFTIRSCGQAERSGLKHYVEAVAAREGTKLSVVYWKESR
jgi:DNA uptake protein ComE-like DNA-binding protein